MTPVQGLCKAIIQGVADGVLGIGIGSAKVF
jgi:hypothetical protein